MMTLVPLCFKLFLFRAQAEAESHAMALLNAGADEDKVSGFVLGQCKLV
jgi:hypothetical protein